MPALKLDMTIPIADAGHVHLAIDVTDIAALDQQQRLGLAETCEEFTTLAAQALVPPWLKAAAAAAGDKPPAAVHDPGASVLDGVCGSRVRDKL